MARFSVGGDENGEGPSTKRIRTLSGHQCNCVLHSDSEEDEQEPEQQSEQDDYIDSEEEEEQQQQRYDDSHEEEGVGSSKDHNESLSVTLTDTDVLDCSICCEPLNVPVFQCENGHIACSSCCTRLWNKCPNCSLPIGYNRCRAIEKVLEAVKVSCVYACYGCPESIRYSDKYNHEKACIFAPCSCPLADCSFVSSSKRLNRHFCTDHTNSATRFRYHCKFLIVIETHLKFRILQEKEDGTLFILNNTIEEIGNVVSISCIAPCSWKVSFNYELRAKNEENSLRFQSITKSIQARVSNPPSSQNFLLVPSGFCQASDQLELQVCIWRRPVEPIV